MGAIVNTTATLASAVADDGTFTLSYPAGYDRQDLVNSTGGKLTVNNNDVWSQGDPGVEFTFGASNITVTNRSGVTFAAGSEVIASFGRSDINGTGGYNVTLGGGAGQAAPGNGDMERDIQELTATGAVTAGVQILELNHATVVAAATIADAADHQGLFIVRNTSASGTAAHTLTLTAGTFDGSNNVATLNAPGEALVVFFDKYGRGQIIENTGAVALS